MEKKDPNINPPYGSVSRLRYVFDLFSTHTFPQITSSFLKSRGFSGSDAFQTISALKFLGIIDTEGNKTEKMSKLQLKGEERTQLVLNIVKNSYHKLFETVAEPNKLSKDDLFNDFISIYGLSGRLAATAVPNFLWLCKEAGLEVPDAPEVKERKPRSRVVDNFDKKATKSFVSGAKKQDTSMVSQSESVELGEFRLILPDGLDKNMVRQAIARGELKIIYDELTRLSMKFKKDENDDAG